jgi:hypothetical protein
MGERTPAGIVAAVFVAPLVLLCCLGPAGVASLFAGIVAWSSGLSVAAITGAAIAGGLSAMVSSGGDAHFSTGKVSSIVEARGRVVTRSNTQAGRTVDDHIAKGTARLVSVGNRYNLDATTLGDTVGFLATTGSTGMIRARGISRSRCWWQIADSGRPIDFVVPMLHGAVFTAPNFLS